MSDVAIVGIGIHPFGRHDLTGLEQGAFAVRARARRRRDRVARRAVRVRRLRRGRQGRHDGEPLGLTGVPFVNVANGCATGGSALISAYNAINAGAADVVMAIGFDKHPRGAFDPNPADCGIGKWYGDTGLMLTTQFFGMKIQRYMHEHGITANTLAKVAAKAFRNGSLNENAWRRQPLTEEEVLGGADALVPADAVHVLLARGGRCGARALPRPRRPRGSQRDPVFLRSAVLRSRPFGSFEVFSPWLAPERGDSPSVGAAEGAFEMAGIGSRRDGRGAGAGHRVRRRGHAPGRVRVRATTASRRS